ncbi:hypothetical protein J3R83DRAFT_6503 [Lanmaoa asiatica]|nr:hypothetical protein J3R83DRAFT_6503 [Lanmaoa asiatica]
MPPWPLAAWSRRACTKPSLPPSIHTEVHAASVYPQLSSSAFGDPKPHVKRRTPLGVHPSSNRVRKIAANPASKKARISEPVGARPIKLKALSVLDFDGRDPGRVGDFIWSDPPVDTGTPVGSPTETLPIPTIPFPTSPQSLYRNLLFITSNPPFSIREATNYYFDWPKTLHSTKSFNLLISLALRSASFSLVRRLFSAMRAESIPENMETWKLHVRWFVRTGKWNDAWKRVLEITGQQNVTTKLHSNTIPLPLWLELFGSQKRGALRHWVIADQKPHMEAGLATDWGLTSETGPDAGYDVHLDAGQESRLDAGVEDAERSTPLLRKRLMPRRYQRPRAVELSQYRALMQVSPLLASSDQVQILPRTILIITRKMYQVGQRNLALSTALSYVESLPPQLKRCDRRRVLDLVNFHLSMVARYRKPGLKQHFAQRRILRKFLHARPDLIPSSTTLFLLLGPFHSSRRSGTLAMQCLDLFERRWGPRVQSRLVRRRVASLALKEGRLDIVEAMMRLEWRCRVFDTFPRTVYTSRRRPWRTLFSRRGAENRRWHLIEEKYRRRLMLRSES